MLAGLLFANQLAEDRADRLVATLAFAGSTLIEHQARQLVGAGVTQIVVVAGRLTPGLLGALSRVARGTTVDTVRSAAEAAEKLHPLARVLMLADGLVAADDTIAALAEEGGDALLTIGGDQAPRSWERVGGRMAWAGVARLRSARVSEVARLPQDYDMQSSLLRIAEQGGALHLTLPLYLLRRGHGLATGERDLAVRRRGMLAALLGRRENWFERWAVAPAASASLPALADRDLSGTVVMGGAGVLGLFAALAAIKHFPATAAVIALLASLVATIGGILASLRGEDRAGRGLRLLALLMPLVVVVLVAWSETEASADSGPLVGGLGLALLALLAERSTPTRGKWWGSAPAYLLTMLPFAWIGHVGWGIGAAALYAAATLAAAIERLRGQA